LRYGESAFASSIHLPHSSSEVPATDPYRCSIIHFLQVELNEAAARVAPGAGAIVD